ncbi:MAG: Arc family DNA-binding protein [Chthonomonas sp.]|nr:Arc family DNA-binding protein [Chthonomonas sp.]
MADKKPFALRLTPEVFEALQRLADDELRSLNGQIEILVREGLLKRGYIRKRRVASIPDPPDSQA